MCLLQVIVFNEQRNNFIFQQILILGVKTYFSDIHIFIGIFWSELVGAIYIMIATDIFSNIDFSFIPKLNLSAS